MHIRDREYSQRQRWRTQEAEKGLNVNKGESQETRRRVSNAGWMASEAAQWRSPKTPRYTSKANKSTVEFGWLEVQSLDTETGERMAWESNRRVLVASVGPEIHGWEWASKARRNAYKAKMVSKIGRRTLNTAWIAWNVWMRISVSGRRLSEAVISTSDAGRRTSK